MATEPVFPVPECLILRDGLPEGRTHEVDRFVSIRANGRACCARTIGRIRRDKGYVGNTLKRAAERFTDYGWRFGKDRLAVASALLL